MVNGPLMLDLEGQTLQAGEQKLLAHPKVGGLILFSRNYSSTEQLAELIKEVRNYAPHLIIAVDHEGGRVQRFREGFTRLPPMAELGTLYRQDADKALYLTQQIGWLIAAELIAFDIDISFAPVLDLDVGISEVIGDRAFGGDPNQVAILAEALIKGMHQAGMAVTGKHFPGHGNVASDSHLEIPVDERALANIDALDMQPFRALASQLDAVMPAHVIYPEVDEHPAGFSPIWIDQILRQQLGFQGVVFSDDLSREGATVAGSYADRAEVALDAGCDMVLVCNDRAAALETLAYLEASDRKGSERIARLRYQDKKLQPKQMNPYWQRAIAEIENHFGANS